MTKKAECEQAIRRLARDWFASLPEAEKEHPSWMAFKNWLREKHYSHYLDFRSAADADEIAEMWFDDELVQNWRRWSPTL